jgi:hypothetical protein
MMKNLFLLALMTWVTLSYAKVEVAKESVEGAHSYKLEKAAPEQEAERSVAGAKIKKKKHESDELKKSDSNEPDSEVRYWQYSE